MQPGPVYLGKKSATAGIDVLWCFQGLKVKKYGFSSDSVKSKSGIFQKLCLEPRKIDILHLSSAIERARRVV